MKPALLLIPGMLNDASLWAEVVAAVQDVAEVRIAQVQTQADVPTMAQDGWALLAGLPPQAPVVLAGFSLGGYVALDMMARPQCPLAAAVLISTSARPESPEGAVSREKTILAMQADFVQVVKGIAKWGTHAAPADLLDRLQTMMLRVGADTGMRQTRAIKARADHRSALGAVTLPVTVLCGAQDRITPSALSEELAGLLPMARLHIIEGAGHMLPMEQPQAVAAALRLQLEGLTL